jgi:hypothetical protein
MDGASEIARESLAGALATGYGDVARDAFVSGMHTAVIVGAAVVLAGAAIALRYLPVDHRVRAQAAAAAA